MITGIDKNERYPFVSESDSTDPGVVKTVFMIGNLTQRDKLALFGQVITKDGKMDAQVIQEKAVDIFLKGVKRIENFPEAGKAVEPVDEAVVDALPFGILVEVVAKVMELNFTTENTRKN